MKNSKIHKFRRQVTPEAMSLLVEICTVFLDGVDNHFDVWSGRSLMLSEEFSIFHF